MKPDVKHTLMTSFMTLAAEIAPKLEGDYSSGTVSSIGVVMALLGEEYDRAADVRLATNNETRTVFAEAAEMVEDRGLAGRLKEAAQGEDVSLRVTDLDASGDALKSLLIELHVYVEEQSADWAREIDAKIWAVIAADVMRNEVKFPQI